MENKELEIGISEKEAVREILQPKEVEVTEIKVESPTMKDGKDMKKKFVFICKHPDKEEPIEISKVKFEKNSGLITSGTWVSLDEQGLLLKNSATATLMARTGAKTVKEMIGRKVPTTQDTNQFLVFKAY